MRQEDGAKAPSRAASEQKRRVEQSLIERAKGKRQLQGRVRQRKEHAPRQQPRYAVELRREKKSVIAEEIDESHGRHEGGRKEWCHEEPPERLAARSPRHCHGVGENTAQNRAQQRREAAYPECVADGAQHRGRQKHPEDVSGGRRPVENAGRHHVKDVIGLVGSTSALKPGGTLRIIGSGGKRIGPGKDAFHRWFIHEGWSYVHEDGQEKYFTIAKGEEWTEGEVFDDFC